MSCCATCNEPIPAAPEGDTQYYRLVLHEMIDLGADLARLVHQQADDEAKAQPSTPSPASNDNRRPAADHAAAFDRIVRTIRRTILLARSLDTPPRPQPASGPNRTATRKRIIRAVEDAIHSGASPADSDRMHAELLDRLDSPEFEHDIATRPAADIIQDIRADLGLSVCLEGLPVEGRRGVFGPGKEGTPPRCGDIEASFRRSQGRKDPPDRPGKPSGQTLSPVPGYSPWKRRTPADLALLHARAAAAHRPAPPWPPPARPGL